MNHPVTVALVALGGYANVYQRALFAKMAAHDVKLVAGIDPNPVGSHFLNQFEAADIPIYPDLDSFYAEATADLVIIAAPIHLHAPLTIKALEHGSHVLCEKPLTATIQDALTMAAAQQKAERFVGIGYQWSYAPAIQALKAAVMAGTLGRPLRLRTRAFWPRSRSYFARNRWAAKLKTARGDWVLDSPAHNATAHYLHNSLYILGATRETSACPISVQAELYRANDVENFDTATLYIHTQNDVDLFFYTTHAVSEKIGPIFTYEFEDAVVEYPSAEGAIIAQFKNGHEKNYGNPFDADDDKLWQAADAVRTGDPPACGIAAATPQLLCINGAQESMWDIVTFPADLIARRRDGESDDTLVWVRGLPEAFEAGYAHGCLPSALPDLGWAHVGKVVDLTDYTHFPSEAHHDLSGNLSHDRLARPLQITAES